MPNVNRPVNFDPRIHHRKSIRLKGYDYSSPGAYFVTLCTANRDCVFGQVVDGELLLNQYGNIVNECWQWLEEQYSCVKLDEMILMPNHLHGIIILEDNCRGDSRIAPTDNFERKSLGRLIGAFKTVSTKKINLIRNSSDTILWQRNYYERIIRDEDELNQIREYIACNPLKWIDDKDNPNNIAINHLS